MNRLFGFVNAPITKRKRKCFIKVDISARIIDITTLQVDAIVNAANSSLAPGGGVCGAIHRAAGPELARACAKVQPCAVGDARITPGYLLPARFVIHAVGPIWHGGHAGEPELLASAYRRSLEVADEHALRSIAFPAISTGIFGYPPEPAAQIAVSTVRAYAEGATHVDHVTFACFSDQVLAAYRAAGV